MSTTLAQRAETLKMARLLGVPAESLDYLAALPAETIRGLRQQATASMFDADRRRFVGMANASRMLPLPILTRIIERAFGPLLCARTAGLLPVTRAIEISERLKTEFLVDTCIELDPRSASDLLAAFPVKMVVEVSRQLAQRDELVTMGRFIDAVSLEAIGAVMKAIEDDGALLRVAFFAEEKSRLNEIVELLPPERLKRIIRFAAMAEAGTWGEAMALISSVDKALTTKLAAITGDLEDVALEHILDSTDAINCWDILLPIVSTMGKPQQQRIANLLARQQEARILKMLRALLAADQLDTLRSLSGVDEAAWQKLEQLAGTNGLSLTAAAPRTKKSKAR